MSQSLVPKELIGQIKERIDLADLVGGYVSLARAGQNLKGLCPFHAEKTPSFMVSPTRQIFHCFGCGEGGDALAFLMKRENLGFMEAVRELGRRAGVDVARALGRPASDQQHTKERIWKTNEAAAAWFRRNLRDPQLGADARRYLASRGIGAETEETFGLGFAPSSWDGLLQGLAREGVRPDELAAAGLVVAKDDGSRRRDGGGYYDRFRGRLMFPILDQGRRVMAFGGRVLGDGLPKYLNSPDLPTFKKGTALYALPHAKEAAWQSQTVMVVEGYFDAIALHQAGIRNVVATLGTALTPDHVQTLGRLARKIVLLFDPDTAGVQAAVRTLGLFKGSGLSVCVVSLPQAHDPDTFVREAGPERFRELAARAPSLLQFAVAQSLAGAASGGLDDRIRSVDAVLKAVHQTTNAVEREECIRLVAEEVGVSQKALLKRYADLADKPSGRASAPEGGRRAASRPRGRAEEHELVRLLLQGQCEPAHVRLLRSEYFSEATCRRIVETALRHVDGDGRVQVQRVLDELMEEAELAPRLTELSLSETHYDDRDAYVRGCLETLARKHRDGRLSELIAQLRAAEREGRTDDANRLNAQVNALRLEKALGAPAV